MREINVKYTNECRKCGASIAVGSWAGYEKQVGIFCLDCIPTDSEEIRRYRQEAADRKADRYEEWANKRQAKAETLYHQDDHYRGDIAFATQPGHIPERARMIKRTEKAFEHANTAERFRERASRLRKVRVAGDADKRRQQQRESVLSWIKVGMRINTCHYGVGVVEKINKKTVKVGSCGSSGTYSTNVDLSFISKC